MNRDEFCALPLASVLALLWDHDGTLASRMSAAEAPRPPQSPKYDTRIRVKNGYSYASECDLGQLQYFAARAAKPPSDPKYLEKQEKELKALGFFIKWRAQNPDAIWSGERYQQGVVKAAPPSSRPRVSDWDDAGTPREATGGAASSDDDYGSGDQLPF